MVGHSRGEIRNPEYISRLRDFTKLRYGKITPTDIDGMIEYKDKAFVFYEDKLDGKTVPFGQKLALERLCSRISAGGAACLVLFLIRPHDCPVPVDYAALLVENAILNGVYTDEYNGLFAKDATDRFLGVI